MKLSFCKVFENESWMGGDDSIYFGSLKEFGDGKYI